MEKKTIGIIGGMGPLATADLFRKIVTNTAAATDQEHLHILIDNNTAIPDRTRALLEGGEDPFPELLKSARRLEEAGAECLVMPCNAAHGYWERLAEAARVPVLSMIELTVRALERAGIGCAGLLAVTGTVRMGLYDRVCRQHGITLLAPDEEGQRAVMDMIYHGVKAGAAQYDTAQVCAAVERMAARGAQTVVLGCTELPVAVELYRLPFRGVDATLELARGAIRFAGGKLREG